MRTGETNDLDQCGLRSRLTARTGGGSMRAVIREEDHMKYALAGVAAVALVAATAAQAHPVKVVGAGTTESCIADAQDATADLRAAVQGCSDALRYQAMSMSDRVATLINRGILRSRMNDARGALDDYNEAISMDGTIPAAYLNRSATLLGLKRYADAKRDADKAIEMKASPLEVATSTAPWPRKGWAT
jgi:tetratricopeptide (TPR) repeat protein